MAGNAAILELERDSDRTDVQPTSDVQPTNSTVRYRAAVVIEIARRQPPPPNTTLLTPAEIFSRATPQVREQLLAHQAFLASHIDTRTMPSHQDIRDDLDNDKY